MQSSVRVSKSLILLCGFFLVAQLINGLLAARNGYPEISNVGFALASYWILGWWFINDSRRHGIKWMDRYLDMGMFLYIAWIFVIPYYLFKTRGWRAIYLIVFVLGIYFGAYLVGAILYSLWSIF